VSVVVNVLIPLSFSLAVGAPVSPPCSGEVVEYRVYRSEALTGHLRPIVGHELDESHLTELLAKGIRMDYDTGLKRLVVYPGLPVICCDAFGD
jgi:hypothetical protein